jgi:large subunit ribosomal protein L6
MSRIGKKPIEVPAGVKINIDGRTIKVEGPKGRLERVVNDQVEVSLEAEQLLVKPLDGSNGTALQGLTRSLLANMVDGVTKGFTKVLEINGIGYRAELKGSTLNLALGYSHPIDYPLPQGIAAEIEKQTKITLTGIDKELLGATAAEIRSFRPPEPYKGKGIKYAEERLLRKAGKTGAK